MPETAQAVEISRIVFKDGSVASFADETARAMLDAALHGGYAVGAIYHSDIAMNPAQEFGGEWELKEYHNFHGEYLYKRLS